MTTELDRICTNCKKFFPESFEQTDFGICLIDEAFGPYLEELLEYGNFDACREVIEEKKFPCSQEACSKYEEIDVPNFTVDEVEDLFDMFAEDKNEGEQVASPQFSFRDHSFSWLLKHDDRLRNVRLECARLPAEERRLAASNEYAAASPEQIVSRASETPEPQTTPAEIMALAIDPDYAPALLAVGVREFALDRKDEAMELLLALAALPGDTDSLAGILETAGSYLLDANDSDHAAKLFEAAAEKFPDNTAFRELLEKSKAAG